MGLGNAIGNFFNNLIQNPIQTIVRAVHTVIDFIQDPVGTLNDFVQDVWGSPSGSGGSSSSSQSNRGDDVDNRGADQARRDDARRRAEIRRIQAEKERRQRELEERFDRDLEQMGISSDKTDFRRPPKVPLNVLQMELNDPLARKLGRAARTRWGTVEGVMGIAHSSQASLNVLFAKSFGDVIDTDSAYSLFLSMHPFWRIKVNAFYQDTPVLPLSGWQATAYEYAIELQVDPVLMMMLIQNEINHKNILDHGDYGLLWSLGSRTFGLGEVAAFRGVEMLNNYPENFTQFSDTFPTDIRNPDGSFNEYAVGWLLYTNEEFNIRTATTYVSDLENQITLDLQELGVSISNNPNESGASLTPTQVQQLMIVAYNTGWDDFSNSLHNRVREGETAVDIVNALVITIDENSEHLNNVMGLQTTTEELTGLSLGNVSSIQSTLSAPGN